MIQNKSDEVPKRFWNMLPDEDKIQYLELKKKFQDSIKQINKPRHHSSFVRDLNDICAYVERRDDFVDVRAIVCGIYFGKGFVCINTQQLKRLICRCKSSINNGLQSMGYSSSKGKIRTILCQTMPHLKEDTHLLRQWTLRGASENSVPLAGKTAILAAFNNSPPEIKIQPERMPFPTPMINLPSARKANDQLRQEFPVPTRISDKMPSTLQTYPNYEDFLLPPNLNPLLDNYSSLDYTFPQDWYNLD